MVVRKMQINLLPQQKRTFQWPLQKILVSITMVVLFSFTFSYGYCTYKMWSVEREYQALLVRHQLLKPTEDLMVAVQAKNRTINEKNNILLGLSQDKFSWYAVVSKFALLTPQGVWLTELVSGDKGIIQLKGVARSYPDLAVFMQNLEQEELFTEPALIKADNSDTTKATQFELVIRVKGILQ